MISANINHDLDTLEDKSYSSLPDKRLIIVKTCLLMGEVGIHNLLTKLLDSLQGSHDLSRCVSHMLKIYELLSMCSEDDMLISIFKRKLKNIIDAHHHFHHLGICTIFAKAVLS